MRRAVLSLLFVPAIAAAAESAPGGTWLTSVSPIEVDEERIVLRCTDVDRRVECKVTATHLLHNPTASDVTTAGAFYGSNEASVELEGKSVRADGTVPPELDAIAAPQNTHESGAPSSRTGFSFTLPAGARGTLATSADIEPVSVSNRHYGGGFDFPAYYARHPILSGKTHSSHRVDFRFLVYPVRAWAGAKKVRVEVRWPSGWNFARPVLDGAPAFDLKDEGAEKVSRTEADGSKAGTLELSFEVLGTTLVNAGPFLGVGGQFDPGEVRLRAGYEIAGPDWASYALAAETNAKDRFLFALTADASLPNIVLLFPGLGVGAGPIVGGGPKGAFGGVRFQGTLSWPFLSMVIPVDVAVPSFTTGSGAIVTGAILAQASF